MKHSSHCKHATCCQCSAKTDEEYARECPQAVVDRMLSRHSHAKLIRWPVNLAACLREAAIGCAGFEAGRFHGSNPGQFEEWRPGCGRPMRVEAKL